MGVDEGNLLVVGVERYILTSSIIYAVEIISCLNKNLNASRPSEHPPIRGENVKSFRWDHRLQIQNLFMAFKSHTGDERSKIRYNYYVFLFIVKASMV